MTFWDWADRHEGIVIAIVVMLPMLIHTLRWRW